MAGLELVLPLATMPCQRLPAAMWTQASMVPVAPRSREWESRTVRKPLVPLKLTALPNLPAVDQEAPVPSVAVLLLPDASAVVVPLPSLNPYPATIPVCAAPLVASRVRHNKSMNRMARFISQPLSSQGTLEQ